MMALRTLLHDIARGRYEGEIEDRFIAVWQMMNPAMLPKPNSLDGAVCIKSGPIRDFYDDAFLAKYGDLPVILVEQHYIAIVFIAFNEYYQNEPYFPWSNYAKYYSSFRE